MTDPTTSPATVRRTVASRVGRSWLGILSVVVLFESTTRTEAVAQLAVNRTEVVFQAGSDRATAEVIEIRNESATTVQAVIKLEDWDRTEDGTNRWLPYGTLPGSCGEALSVFPLALSLDPGEVQSVRIARDSAHARTGECWAAAVVETVVPRVDAGRAVSYHLRLATKIYLMSEALSGNGELVSMQVAHAATAPATRQLDLIFANTGARHLESTGEVQIRRPDNSVAGSVNLPTLYTLPGARSRAIVTLPDLPPGRYVILAVFDFGGAELAAGQLEYEVAG